MMETITNKDGNGFRQSSSGCGEGSKTTGHQSQNVESRETKYQGPQNVVNIALLVHIPRTRRRPEIGVENLPSAHDASKDAGNQVQNRGSGNKGNRRGVSEGVQQNNGTALPKDKILPFSGHESQRDPSARGWHGVCTRKANKKPGKGPLSDGIPSRGSWG